MVPTNRRITVLLALTWNGINTGAAVTKEG